MGNIQERSQVKHMVFVTFPSWLWIWVAEQEIHFKEKRCGDPPHWTTGHAASSLTLPFLSETSSCSVIAEAAGAHSSCAYCKSGSWPKDRNLLKNKENKVESIWNRGSEETTEKADFPSQLICWDILKIIWSNNQIPAALFIHIWTRELYHLCVHLSMHVISLMSGPNIILLCAPPPSYDPNPQVWVCVCGFVCVSHGPILPPSVSQLISVSMQVHNRGRKKHRE